MSEFTTIILRLFEGFGTTCVIFFATLLFALPLGLLLSFGSMSSFKPLRKAVHIFVWIIRGTPLMLQILIIYFGPALMFGWGFLERISSIIIAFVINYACYFSEIYRGGIQSISQGQYEAGQVLGMTRSQIFTKVILLQVIKRVLAPMSNEVITLVKDTSLARVIAVEEILMAAYYFVARGVIWPLFFSGLYYLLFIGALTLLFNWLEKKLSYFKV